MEALSVMDREEIAGDEEVVRDEIAAPPIHPHTPTHTHRIPMVLVEERPRGMVLILYV